MSNYKWKPFTLLVSAEEVEKDVEKDVGVKLEAGKYYKTRDGRKVGPAILRIDLHSTWPWDVGDQALRCHNGKVGGNGTFDDSFDIISEWSESPIRTVTRREIVAGVYGRLHVSRDFSMEDKNLRIALSDSLGKPDTAGHYWNLDELDEVIHTLSQIREVIEEEKGK